MKSLISCFLMATLVLALLAIPDIAEEKIQRIGTLTLLNLSEAD